MHTDAWRRESEVHGGWFRVSPLVTHVECVADGGKTTRKTPGDFESDDFKDIPAKRGLAATVVINEKSEVTEVVLGKKKKGT